MISNNAPDGPVAAATPARRGDQARSGGGAVVTSLLRGGGGVSILLREVALLPVLVLLIIVGTVVSPAFLTVVELRRDRAADLGARRRRGRREPDHADRRDGPVA